MGRPTTAADERARRRTVKLKMPKLPQINFCYTRLLGMRLSDFAKSLMLARPNRNLKTDYAKMRHLQWRMTCLQRNNETCFCRLNGIAKRPTCATYPMDSRFLAASAVTAARRDAAQSSDPSRRLTSNSRKKTLTVSGRSGAATLSDAQAKARFGARAIQNRVKWRSGNLRRVFPIGFDGTRRARDE
jgi:hypothetical protein